MTDPGSGTVDSGGMTTAPGGTSPARCRASSRAKSPGAIGCREAACSFWMVCLKSCTVAASGGRTLADAATAPVEFLGLLLPPVSHITRTMTLATAKITSCWVFFGSKPAGFAALFSIVPRNEAPFSTAFGCSLFSNIGHRASLFFSVCFCSTVRDVQNSGASCPRRDTPSRESWKRRRHRSEARS